MYTAQNNGTKGPFYFIRMVHLLMYNIAYFPQLFIEKLKYKVLRPKPLQYHVTHIICQV